MIENLTMSNGFALLQSSVNSDMMLLGSEEALVIERMVREKYVEFHHKRAISYLGTKGLWRTFVGTPRKEVTRKTREDLIEYLYQFYKAKELSSSTIRDVFERSEQYRRDVLNRSENTIQRDYQVLERFYTDEFLSQSVTTLTDDDIGRFFNNRSKELHLKERAVKDSLNVLIRTLDHAMRRERIIMDNPAKRVDLQNFYQNCDTSMKSSDEKIYTELEIAEIKARIKAEMSEKEYDIIGYAMLFSIETGVRVAEIPPLRWSDVSDKGIHIHRQQRMTRIKGKGRTFEELPFTKNERRHPKGGRYFPITDSIEDILQSVRRLHEENGIQSGFIFCNEDGTWLNKETYSQRLRRLCRRIGLNITNNHAFRMSLNSNVFIPLGIPVTQRAYLLGHSVETNERFYSHMRTESLADIKNMLNQSTHTHSHCKIVRFSSKKIPQTLVK